MRKLKFSVLLILAWSALNCLSVWMCMECVANLFHHFWLVLYGGALMPHLVALLFFFFLPEKLKIDLIFLTKILYRYVSKFTSQFTIQTIQRQMYNYRKLTTVTKNIAKKTTHTHTLIYKHNSISKRILIGLFLVCHECITLDIFDRIACIKWI